MNTVKRLKTDGEIYAKIDSLYKTNGGFIFHMIKSIFPICKITRVENFWKINNKLRMCCFSNQRLTDIDTIAKIAASKENMQNSLLISVFADKKTPICNIESYLKNDKRLALMGVNSDKMFCIQGYSVFCKWIKDMVEKEDFAIIRLVVHNFIETYETDILNRFNTTIRWEKVSKTSQVDFMLYVNERVVPEMILDYRFIWEKVGGRIVSRKKVETKAKNK